MGIWFMFQQTRRSIQKLLEWENNRLYHKVRMPASSLLAPVWNCFTVCVGVCVSQVSSYCIMSILFGLLIISSSTSLSKLFESDLAQGAWKDREVSSKMAC